MAAKEIVETWQTRVIARLNDLEMTKSGLARAVEMSPSRLGNYLKGTREPGLVDFGRIASALGVTSDWLLFGGVNRPGASRVPASGISVKIDSLPATARRDIEGYIRVVKSRKPKSE